MEAPEFFQGGFCRAPAAQFGTEKRISDTKPGGGDYFFIEDLLDFPNDDAVITDGTFDTVTGTSTDSSTVTVVDSCNSVSGCEPQLVGDVGSRNYSTDAHFSGDLCVPYDDLAELEWLSNIVEESFSSEDLEKLQLISGMKASTEEASETRDFQPENHQNPPIQLRDFPAKARSKRARAMPCKWTSRLLALSPTSSSSETEAAPPNSGKKSTKSAPKKKESPDPTAGGGSDGRKCLHCATDKTPQWRTGPMGPKTLCNACGVRYKSGRLVPEYRPAASPTFVLTKHSNSHRKVLELRRQKEMQRSSQHQHQHQHQQPPFIHHQNMVFEVPNGDDYLIHQHLGPDFRHLI